ncbi:hypothetical protein [Micromonospora radicis]|uniref:Uncharacterized protein n=1 Tax=Micromonospora radicis TaxID=1894971 RepID=A0A418MQ94_9ACTN|nr:hypothetical protein [Micromonospora radicis]RIV35542.1 hypothetical protein D2L64_21585 [Micromonospora radicis]
MVSMQEGGIRQAQRNLEYELLAVKNGGGLTVGEQMAIDDLVRRLADHERRRPALTAPLNPTGRPRKVGGPVDAAEGKRAYLAGIVAEFPELQRYHERLPSLRAAASGSVEPATAARSRSAAAALRSPDLVERQLRYGPAPAGAFPTPSARRRAVARAR